MLWRSCDIVIFQCVTAIMSDCLNIMAYGSIKTRQGRDLLWLYYCFSTSVFERDTSYIQVPTSTVMLLACQHKPCCFHFQDHRIVYLNICTRTDWANLSDVESSTLQYGYVIHWPSEEIINKMAWWNCIQLCLIQIAAILKEHPTNGKREEF